MSPKTSPVVCACYVMYEEAEVDNIILVAI